MHAHKSPTRTAVATILMATACLAACSTSTTNSNAGTGNTQPEIVVNTSNESTPTEAAQPEEYTVLSATMSNRSYTDANLQPYRIQPGDTYNAAENGRIRLQYNGFDGFTPVSGESHTRYDVTVTYTIQSADGEIITKTVPRDKIRVVSADTDQAIAYGTKEQVSNGEVTFKVPVKSLTSRDGGRVNLVDVTN